MTHYSAAPSDVVPESGDTDALNPGRPTEPDFRAVFDHALRAAIIVRSDAPRWTIVAASDAYLAATLKQRDAIVGRGIFEVFPESTGTESAGGEHNVRGSFESVVATGAGNKVGVQRYDLPRTAEQGGGFEERYWEMGNLPLTGPDGNVAFVFHYVDDVTAVVHGKQDRDAAWREADGAREIAEQAARRAKFMAHATSLLFASMDYGSTLAELAHVAIPTIGDWCAIDVVESDGSFRRLAVAHRDPAKIELAKELERKYPEDPDSPTGRASVLASGIPVFYPELTDEMIDLGARDAEHARLIHSLGLKSFIIAPLIAREHRLGTITVVMAESGRHYTEDDVELVQDLANRAAIAIDNARLFGEVTDGRSQLEEQAMELELQAAHLQETMTELQVVNEHLTEQAVETESAQETLQENAVELEHQAEELQRSNEELERQRAAAESARRRASSILESITDAFFALDLDWRFTYVNARAEEIFRRSWEDLVGKNVWIEFPYIVGSPFERIMREAAHVHQHVRGEEYHSQRGRWFEIAAYPSHDGLAVYLQDVTDRHEIQHALFESEERYRFLADAIPVQVWTATPDGALDYVSRRVTTYFERPSGDIVDSGWLEVLHPDDVDRVAARWSRSLTTGESYEVEFRLWSPAHEQHRWHLGRAVPFRDAVGNIIKWVGSNTEIEDQKRAEQERERLQREAENANRAKMEFLANMSHELRTPLNAINGYAELMEMGVVGPVTEGQHEYLARVQRSGKFLLSLINDVLNFAKLDAGAVEIRRQPVRLNVILSAAHTLVEPQMRAKDLTYRYDGCNDHWIVLGDDEKIEQILLNLLSNAVKFTASGGQITLVCDEENGFARMHVSDTGRGIPADRLSSIFDPFVQVDRNASAGSQQGVGLGLAISRELARRMDGDLTVRSEVSKGSTFTLSLPLAK